MASSPLTLPAMRQIVTDELVARCGSSAPPQEALKLAMISVKNYWDLGGKWSRGEIVTKALAGSYFGSGGYFVRRLTLG